MGAAANKLSLLKAYLIRVRITTIMYREELLGGPCVGVSKKDQMVKFFVVTIVVCVLGLAGFALKKRPELFGLPEAPVGLSSIKRTPGYFMEGRAESSLVLLKGRIVAIVSVHNGAEGKGVIVRDLDTKSNIQEIEWPYRFASAINHGEDILVIGSKRIRVGTEIGLLRLGADLVVKEKSTLFRSMDHIANSSLAYDGTRYVMAIEVESAAGGQFHPRFMVSRNLRDWSIHGVDMLPDEYAACPTIRYLDGWYYIFYLRSHRMGKSRDGQQYAFSTRLGRTKDFRTFDTQHYGTAPVVLAPEGGEGVNTSDLDLLEHNGRVHIVYDVGNQLSNGHLRTAVYEGTLGEMVREIW
jgi:hypothetical protein